MKITNENINTDTAKFWCVFSSREYKEFFSYMEQQIAAAKGKKPASKKKVSESVMSTVKEKALSVWNSVKNYVKSKGRKIFNSGV